MGSMGEASVGAGGLGHRGLLGLRGRSLLPLALLCLVFGAGGHQQPPGEVQDEVGFEGFDEVNEVGDYEEYEDEYVTEGEEVEEDWVDYEYVDLQKDSDGDGLRDHINDPDDDDGDGVTDREDSDWFAHDEM